MLRRFIKADIRDWQNVFASRPANTAEAVIKAQRLRELSRRILGDPVDRLRP